MHFSGAFVENRYSSDLQPLDVPTTIGVARAMRENSSRQKSLREPKRLEKGFPRSEIFSDEDVEFWLAKRTLTGLSNTNDTRRSQKTWLQRKFVLGTKKRQFVDMRRHFID